MNKTIYTFWEPKDKIPAYIQCCISTWKKFLSDYDIVILDYNNIDKYLGENFFNKCLYEKFTLPTQADAIRCAILHKYGGIWMDCDTIVTSDKIVNLLNTDKDFIQFGKHIGFIAANKESIILSKWLKEIKIRLFIHKYFRFFLKKFDKNYRQKYTNWDFLGNSILDKLLLNSTSNDYLSLDRIKLKVLPEINYYMNTYKDQDDTNLREMYRKFYFENDFSDYALDNECGIILLHNSRTPYEYQTFNKEEFLKENNTLSNIFKKLLDGDL